MAEIQPFRGILYRPQEHADRVLAPPYDVISPEYRDELYARDPHNIVRVVLNRAAGDAGYTDAGETYKRWLQDGTLQEDASPALYLLEQRFEAPGGELQRLGLLTRFRAEDPERRIILPHEHTRAAAKEDRWRVLQATRANFSPIFLMFPDGERRFEALAAAALGRPPLVSYSDDSGVGHRLWRIEDAATIGGLQSLLARTKCYIADGHHRHATALRHRDGVGPDGAWTLGYFTPVAPGLLVLPYHRILAEAPSLAECETRLQRHFRVSREGEAPAAADRVARSRAAYAFAFAEAGEGALVVEADQDASALLPSGTPASLRALDTYFLHQAVLGPILGIADAAVRYVHSQAEAEHALASRACRLAALMRATPVRQIMDVAEAGESMPAKSTCFHPKLPSGLVIHPLLA